MILNFKVNNQELTLDKKDSLANKSHDILECVFDFNGDDWNDKEIFALLFNSNRQVYELHVENNKIIIPSTITQGSKFKISLYGEDLTPKRITTNMVTINLRESGYTTDIEDLEDIDPTIWTQIWTAIDSKSNIDHVHLVADITDFPETMPPSSHTHKKVDITDFQHSHTVRDISDFPDIPSKTSDLVNDGDGTNVFVKDNDSRLTDTRNPKPHTHLKSDITDFPVLANVATSGSYNDLKNKPSIPSKISDLTNDSDFVEKSNTNGLLKNDGTVDTTTYVDTNDSRLSDSRTPKPHTHTKNQITDFPSLANVATSGSYNDLINKPTIPTKISDLTDDSDFISKNNTAGLVKNDGTIDTTQYISDISGKINYTDIVDNLTTNDSEKPLSAKQGKELAEMIGDIQTYVNR